MSFLENRGEQQLAGLSLDDVLLGKKPATTSIQTHKTRTLLDIIREDESNKKDRRSWKAFKDKLRLKRAGSIWTTPFDLTTSDIIISSPNIIQLSDSVRFSTLPNSYLAAHYMAHHAKNLDPSDDSDSPAPASKNVQFGRRASIRFTPNYDTPFTGGDLADTVAKGSLKPALSRRGSRAESFRRGRVVTFRDEEVEANEDEEAGSGAVRTLSAREAVAAQEAAEAAALEEDDMAGKGGGMMSLMDLLEETDREMGLEGSRYILSDDDFDDEDDEEEEEEMDGEYGEGSLEYTCCICKVRHKGNAFVSCGHSFCRMCSRDLNVSKGNCPICNNFLLEVLDIF